MHRERAAWERGERRNGVLNWSGGAEWCHLAAPVHTGEAARGKSLIPADNVYNPCIYT